MVIRRLRPILFDPDSGIALLPELSPVDEQVTIVEAKVNGFDSEPVSSHPPYTHRIWPTESSSSRRAVYFLPGHQFLAEIIETDE